MNYLPNYVQPRLPRVAAELNNVGVLFHEGNRFDDAQKIYRDAMQVLITFRPCQEEQAGHENIEETQRWNTVLMKWNAVAEEKLACNPSSRPNFPVLAAAPSDYHKMPSVCSRPLSVEIRSDQPVDVKTISLLLLHNLAIIQLLKGEKKKAEQLFGMAMSQIPNELEINATAGIAAFAVHFNSGMLSYEEGRLQESLHMLSNALNLAETVIGDHMLIAGTLNGVGKIFLQNGMMHQALEMFVSASRILFAHFKERKGTSVIKGRNGNGASAA